MRSEKRKWIDITRDFKSGGDDYFNGERIYAAEADALRWISAGFAADVSGELPSGAPDVSPKTLKVQSDVHGTASDRA